MIFKKFLPLNQVYLYIQDRFSIFKEVNKVKIKVMSNKEKAQQLEKEIRQIDFVIITLMLTGLVESVLAVTGIVDMDILSFLIISASLYLLFVNARKRSIKELTKRVNEAVYMTEEEYYEKYPN